MLLVHKINDHDHPVVSTRRYIHPGRFYIVGSYQYIMEQHSINERLDRIETTLGDIREALMDPDSLLTEEEKRLVENSFDNQREGKMVSLEEIKDARDNSR